VTQNTETKLQSGVREGTAKRRGGKETANRILQAAEEILTEENLAKFSMRNVANRADINLRNLQYYFPTRQDLVQALYLKIDERYRGAYARCIEGAEQTPLGRFKAILEFNLQDITQRKTRQFFMQLWVLLGSLDNFEGQILGRLFSIHIEQLSEYIAAVQPSIPETELKNRATLLEGMLEGLMVVLSTQAPEGARTDQIVQLAYQQCLAIALGKAS
jgi:AcrR family transcriptional regulator